MFEICCSDSNRLLCNWSLDVDLAVCGLAWLIDHRCQKDLYAHKKPPRNALWNNHDFNSSINMFSYDTARDLTMSWISDAQNPICDSWSVEHTITLTLVYICTSKKLCHRGLLHVHSVNGPKTGRILRVLSASWCFRQVQVINRCCGIQYSDSIGDFSDPCPNVQERKHLVFNSAHKRYKLGTNEQWLDKHSHC